MRLSWNEVRARAAAFAREWRDAAYEKGETQSFYNEFFEVFGVRRRTVARYEEHVAKLDNRRGFIDLFWPSVLIVEQKSAGRDLDKAYGQAGEYFDALPERERPRYIMVSDFQTFELRDLEGDEAVAFALVDARNAKTRRTDPRRTRRRDGKTGQGCPGTPEPVTGRRLPVGRCDASTASASTRQAPVTSTSPWTRTQTWKLWELRVRAEVMTRRS